MTLTFSPWISRKARNGFSRNQHDCQEKQKLHESVWAKGQLFFRIFFHDLKVLAICSIVCELSVI
jgi:hypothetical protein